MIRASGNSVRIAAIASMPFMSGRRRSMSVMSGRCWRNRSRPSFPVLASATSSMSRWLLIIAEIPSRRSGWSSTLRMRMGAGALMRLLPFV